MSVTHSEFLRGIPLAAGAQPCTLNGNEVVIGTNRRYVRITLADERTRTLGALRLPSTRVTLIFQGYTMQEAEAFLVHFDRCYHKGGG